MKINLPLFFAYRSEEVEKVCLEVLRSGFIATGPYVELFTKAFGKLIGSPNVVTTSDVSNSVQIALHLAGVKSGDEVLAMPYSCMSSNSPIPAIGAKAVWVDMDPSTATIDLDSLKKSITSKSKALILYHVAGYPGPVQEVAAICKEHGIVLIEDCNNALLATIGEHQVGQWGEFAIYSFYPNRQINAGEGGALVCKRQEDADRAMVLRRYGIDSKTFRDSSGEINPNSDIPEVGWAAILNNLCSGMGFVQIASVQERIEQVRKNAERYDSFFLNKNNVLPIQKLSGANPSYWVYLIRSPKRDELMSHLKQSGISCSKIHQLNSVYSGFKTAPVELPGSNEFMNQVLGIPCGWWLNNQQIEFLFDRINEKL